MTQAEQVHSEFAVNMALAAEPGIIPNNQSIIAITVIEWYTLQDCVKEKNDN